MCYTGAPSRSHESEAVIGLGITELAPRRMLYRPETLVVGRSHCCGSCFIRNPYVRAACQGKGGRFHFRVTSVFEIAPSPLRDVERRAIKPRPSKDSEHASFEFASIDLLQQKRSICARWLSWARSASLRRHCDVFEARRHFVGSDAQPANDGSTDMSHFLPPTIMRFERIRSTFS